MAPAPDLVPPPIPFAPEAVAEPAKPQSKPRLEILDGIRFLAAVYVVIFHFSAGDRSSWPRPSHELFQPVFAVASYGWLGVELFFMISGFVICMSTWGKTFTQFAISRVVRLYPAYWFGVLFTTAILLLDQSRAVALPWRQVVDNLTMTEQFSRQPYVDPSYWTLTIELIFYIMVAVTLVAWGFTYKRVVGFCVVWLAISLLDTTFTGYYFSLIVEPLYAPFFVAGLVLYLIHRFGPSPVLWTLLGCTYAIGLYRLISRTAGQTPSGVHLHYWIAVTIMTAFFVVLTLVALGKLSMLRGRWLVTAGALTYPLYLLHQQIGETWIESLSPYVPSWVLMWGTFAVMLALAYVVQRWVERPVARMTRTILYALRDSVTDLGRRAMRRQPETA
ncbi:MAG TPA: acyltransferase [Micromonosporaceae bacterium]